MPSFEISTDIFTRLSEFDSPKGSSNTFKTRNISAFILPCITEQTQEIRLRSRVTESHLFRKSNFDRIINKFVEAHSYHFTLLDSLHDNVTDTDDYSNLVVDVDSDTLIRIVRSELKNGKAPSIDNVFNDILKKAISTGFYKLLARAFTISLKLGFISYVWKVTCSPLYAHQA